MVTPTVTRFVWRYFVTQGVCHSGRVTVDVIPYGEVTPTVVAAAAVSRGGGSHQPIVQQQPPPVGNFEMRWR